MGGCVLRGVLTRTPDHLIAYGNRIVAVELRSFAALEQTKQDAAVPVQAYSNH